MNIPKSILISGVKPHWAGKIQDEEILIYLDEEMSKYSPVNVFAVFSNMGFHGWINEGYKPIELLWTATAIPISYEVAAEDLKNNEEIFN